MYRARVWLSRYQWAWLDRAFTPPIHDSRSETFEQAVISARNVADQWPAGIAMRADVREVRS